MKGPSETLRIARAGLALMLAAATLGACVPSDIGDGAGINGGSGSIALVGFAVPKAANDAVAAAWQRTAEGRHVTFATSYGASGDQSRAVVAGLPADYVHFSVEGDITRLVKAGLVADDWDHGPTRGIVSQSVVVLVVRKGNPRHIAGWDDIVRPGIEIVTPNPGSSGTARWNIVAAWAHATGGMRSVEDGRRFMEKFFGNAVTLANSGREATTAFQRGTGDVLVSTENEAIFARHRGVDLDYVIPDDTLLVQNPATVTVSAGSEARKFLAFVQSDSGQRIVAANGFRPVSRTGRDIEVGLVDGANDPEHPYPPPNGRLFTVADLGGWAVVNRKLFATSDKDGVDGIVTAIENASGKGS